MYNLVKVAIVIFLLLYPILIYFGLNYFSPSQLGIFFLVLFAIRSLFTRTKSASARWQIILTVTIGGTLAALTWIYNSEEYLLWYPVGLNITFFIIFASSLIFPPSVIERIARAFHKEFPESAVVYTRNVTIVWTSFFIINTFVSGWTVLHGDMEIWTLYNGLISYFIVALLLGAELIVRKIVKQQ
jgi:uncharacterized membrane protein